jgi:F-type H+-transporting ATPase subunit delta
MIENLIIARPYANAAFAVAKEQEQLDRWQEMLTFLADSTEDPEFKESFTDPRITWEQLAELLIALLPAALVDEFVTNFINILASEHRVAVLPEIAELYVKLVLEYKKILIARVVSRGALTTQQQEKLSAVLAQKFQKQIQLKLETNENILGGLVVYINDMVYDGSLRNKLYRLKSAAAGL